MIRGALLIGGIGLMKAYLWLFLVPFSIFGTFRNEKLEDILSK